MRKWKPYCPQLEKPGSAGVENAPRNVDMGDGVAIEKQIAVAQVIEERRDRNSGGKLRYQNHLAAGSAGLFHENQFIPIAFIPGESVRGRLESGRQFRRGSEIATVPYRSVPPQTTP